MEVNTNKYGRWENGAKSGGMMIEMENPELFYVYGDDCWIITEAGFEKTLNFKSAVDEGTVSFDFFMKDIDMTGDVGTQAEIFLFWDGAGDTALGSNPRYVSSIAMASDYPLKTWNSFSKTFSSTSDTAATSHTLTIGMDMQAMRLTCEPHESDNGQGNKYVLRIDNVEVTTKTSN
ncbi:hypothetical protein SEMRO_822_G207480.1 [Seminavis robusta]|uniref:Uncharacterized protein n=1 Tax=Seminavis robusta TaxID=568900 RepID=A0A9N8EB20_9STRA|nr:hypothetical protein SEMRO_822_G207480.1 [Seminavis robusta]|eukprot:Sro822_g207480.1 n/a (176) ;mRNA; f:24327-24854